ncbi:MAG: hypothetical protein AAGC70_14580 [Pseudomonadota bacterium]
MSSTTHIDNASAIAHSETAKSPLRAVLNAGLDFFISLDRAIKAAHEYENLSRLSDARLNEMGLERQQLGRHVVEKHLSA